MRDNEYEWDDEKAAANLAWHRVSFETARRAFDEIDWSAVDAMTEEERHAAAMADPEATAHRPKKSGRRRAECPGVRTLRRALKSARRSLAARHRIPVGTLRDWEQAPQGARRGGQGRYLHVIASELEMVREALARRQRQAPQGEAA